MWSIIPLLVSISQQAPVSEGESPGGRPKWPIFVPLEVVRPVETNYPIDALRHGQEGTVTAEVLVGLDGVPRDCRILASSGHQALDAGTCDIFLESRYAPPRNEQGENVETSFMPRIQWVLPERPRRPFLSSSMTVQIGHDQGQVTNCNVSGAGPLFADWQKVACGAFARHIALRANATGSKPRRVEVYMQMIPGGNTPADTPRSAETIAHQELEFELSKTSVRRCQLVGAQNFGDVLFDENQLCGLFMSEFFRFERPSNSREVRRGVVTIDLLRKVD